MIDHIPFLIFTQNYYCASSIGSTWLHERNRWLRHEQNMDCRTQILPAMNMYIYMYVYIYIYLYLVIYLIYILCICISYLVIYLSISIHIYIHTQIAKNCSRIVPAINLHWYSGSCFPMSYFIIPNKVASTSHISEPINQGIVKIANLRCPAKKI